MTYPSPFYQLSFALKSPFGIQDFPLCISISEKSVCANEANNRNKDSPIILTFHYHFCYKKFVDFKNRKKVSKHFLLLSTDKRKINFDDFIAVMVKISEMENKKLDEDLNQAFEVFDREKKGYFKVSELLNALNYMPGAVKVSRSEIAEILYKSDENKDGLIQFKGRNYNQSIIHLKNNNVSLVKLVFS